MAAARLRELEGEVLRLTRDLGTATAKLHASRLVTQAVESHLALTDGQVAAGNSAAARERFARESAEGQLQAALAAAAAERQAMQGQLQAMHGQLQAAVRNAVAAEWRAMQGQLQAMQGQLQAAVRNAVAAERRAMQGQLQAVHCVVAAERRVRNAAENIARERLRSLEQQCSRVRELEAQLHALGECETLRRHIGHCLPAVPLVLCLHVSSWPSASLPCSHLQRQRPAQAAGTATGCLWTFGPATRARARRRRRAWVPTRRQLRARRRWVSRRVPTQRRWVSRQAAMERLLPRRPQLSWTPRRLPRLPSMRRRQQTCRSSSSRSA